VFYIRKEMEEILVTLNLLVS